MKRRLFIALNLPEKLKDSIEREVEKIRFQFTDDMRFIGREQWHITVSFLGHQQDEFMGKIIGAMESAVKKDAPMIKFNNISYGPKGGTPRMIWLNGDDKTSENIGRIKQIFEDNLVDNGINLQRREYKKYKTHITLAKFKTMDDLPELSAPFTDFFQPESLDLMESRMSPKGASYDLLQKIKFRV